MRLTLRTLLAYLDDMLEPAEARDMGAKVAESGVAQSLIARIKDVLRRRRLLAPDVDGPGMGVDPNIVAEYLDNVIPPDDVAEIEKIFLGSDIHLAEVAASHQILTLVLGDPVQVVPRSRERMYALGPLTQRPPADGREATSPNVTAIDVSVPSENGRSNGARPPLRAVPAAALPAESPATVSRIPDYLRSKPLWQRLLTPLVVLSLLAVFGTLVYEEFWTGSPTAENSTTENATTDNTEPELGAPSDVPGAKPGTPVKPTEIAARTPEPGLGPHARAIPIDPPPPEEPSEVPLKPPVDPEKAGSIPDKPVAIPAPGGSKTDVAGKPAVPAPPPPGDNPGNSVPLPAKPADALPIEYVSTEGVLLRFDSKAAGWYLMPRRSLIHAGEIIASPEPFETLLSINKGAGTATVVGGSALTILGPTNVALFGFDVRQGRMIVQTKKAGDEGPEELIFALKVGRETWKIDLNGAGAICAIEVTPREPDGFEQNLGQNTWSGRLYVTAGSAGVLDPAGRKLKLDANMAIALAPMLAVVAPPPPLTDAPDKADADKPKEDAVPVAPPPGADEGANVVITSPAPRWMDPAARTPVRRYAVQFEKNFDATHSVAESMPSLVIDPTFQIAELAVRTLALTQHYSGLVKALATSPHKESRLVAISGLRAWLGGSPNRGPLLKEELALNFAPEENVSILYELLWGYNQADARNPEKSTQLVDWLENDQLAIRELAFYHLHRITNLKYDYDASNPVSRRTLAAERWRKHIKNEGGTLLKK